MLSIKILFCDNNDTFVQCELDKLYTQSFESIVNRQVTLLMKLIIKTILKEMNVKLRKYLPILIVLGLVTCISTFAKKAPDDSFFSKWLSFYALALVIIAPSALFLMARMKKKVSDLLQDKNRVVQGLAFAIPVVLVMSTLMSGLMTFVFGESETLSHFFSLWAEQLQSSLPVFLTVGVIMGGVIRPLIALRKLKKA